MPLTTVTIVVEPVFSVPVVETELEEEVDSKNSVEVEGVGVISEKVEVLEVVRIGIGEDGESIGANDVGVVLVGVDGCSVVVGTGCVIVLVFVVKKVVSREHRHIPSC